jgi:hypothetical protein
MRPSVSYTGCLVIVALAVSAVDGDAQEKGKKPDPKALQKMDFKGLKKEDPKEVKEKMINSGVLPGRVIGVDAEQKILNLRVTLLIAVPNLDVAQGLIELQVQLIQTARNGDVDGFRETQAQMLEQYAILYSIEEREEDVALQLIDGVKVRKLRLPPARDAKGKPRKYTPKELRDLKGADKLPGFPVDLKELQEDQFVQVQLVKRKTNPRTKEEKLQALQETPKAAVVLILSD